MANSELINVVRAKNYSSNSPTAKIINANKRIQNKIKRFQDKFNQSDIKVIDKSYGISAETYSQNEPSREQNSRIPSIKRNITPEKPVSRKERLANKFNSSEESYSISPNLNNLDPDVILKSSYKSRQSNLNQSESRKEQRFSIKNYEDIADSSELINQRREQGQNNTGISNSAIKSKPSMPNVISSQFKNAKGLNNPPSRSQNQRIPKLGNKIEKLNFGDISRYNESQIF